MPTDPSSTPPRPTASPTRARWCGRWVPYEDDPSQGKDRPVLLLAERDGQWLGLMLSSQDHDLDAEDEARYGRSGWTSAAGRGTVRAGPARSGSTGWSCSTATASAARAQPCRRRPSTRSSPRPASTTTWIRPIELSRPSGQPNVARTSSSAAASRRAGARTPPTSTIETHAPCRTVPERGAPLPQPVGAPLPPGEQHRVGPPRRGAVGELGDGLHGLGPRRRVVADPRDLRPDVVAARPPGSRWRAARPRRPCR